MTRARLRQYRAICAEIGQLEREIGEVKRDVQSDVVLSSEGPALELLPVTIQGVSAEARRKLEELSARLTCKRAAKIRLREEIEDYLDSVDGETAAILRGKYVEGLTWRQVAQRIGKSSDGVRMRAKRTL